MPDNKILFIICITVAMLMVIAGFSVHILTLFQKRKMRLLRQQQEIKENYEKEILKTQIEIRDQAMNDVGTELHDHINQLMALVKINLNLLASKGLDAANEERLSDTKDLVKEAINDIRMLSKTLNGDLVLQAGLVESIRHELERINRLKLIRCELQAEGAAYPIDPNTAFIVFRVVQENLQNILKHAQAKTVITKLIFTPGHLILSQQDDGVGYAQSAAGKTQGSGLINMKRRATMINADLQLESEPGKGTLLTLTIRL